MNRRTFFQRIVGAYAACVAAVVHPIQCLHARTWFVSSAARVSGDGSSLGTAKKTLADAVAAAAPGDTIYIAAGHNDIQSYPITITKESLTIVGHNSGRPAFSGISTGA